MTKRVPEPQSIICKVSSYCGTAEACEKAGECGDEDLLVNNILAGAYDLKGISAWWDRPRSQLDGKTPRDVWNTDRDKVWDLARLLEASNGT